MNVDQRKLRKIMESIFSQEAQDNFRRGEMWRSAEMTVNLNVPFGIFSLVGADVAPKVLKARGDRTTEILEALAFAYKEMKDRVDPEGQYYATYVNHVENLLLSFGEATRDRALCDQVRSRFQEFRDRYGIPADDPPDRKRQIRELFESALSPDDRHRALLTRLPTLQRLWELEAELKQRPGGSRWPFSGIGLGLTPLCRRYYFCTPLNAETFATTQGDGVHFSLLLSDGEVSEDSPVVMTLPANSGDHNRIVGENLREFLALGIDCSYSMLEQIVYQGFERFDIRDRDGQSAENRTVLDEIARMFDLSPWPSPAERFAELNANYLPLLRHPVDWLDD